MTEQRFATVDEYIGSFPASTQAVLEEIRRRIRSIVPDAGEVISYQIPAITVRGRHLVYFAGWKHHVSVYPLPDADDGLQQELAPYVAGKGTAKFPLSKPIPYDLIDRLVARLAQQRGDAPG